MKEKWGEAGQPAGQPAAVGWTAHLQPPAVQAHRPTRPRPGGNRPPSLPLLPVNLTTVVTVPPPKASRGAAPAPPRDGTPPPPAPFPLLQDSTGATQPKPQPTPRYGSRSPLPPLLFPGSVGGGVLEGHRRHCDAMVNIELG